MRKSVKRHSSARASSCRGSSFLNHLIHKEEDAEKISYVGLKRHVQLNHPSREDGSWFSLCENIGSLPPFVRYGNQEDAKKRFKIPEVSKELGLGASLLLVVTKELIWLFLTLTTINLPVLAIFYHQTF